ncbi:hypothetical protein BCT35_05130 [Vibrio lentus]|uniref:hypothetical protein n=1 Tax=Vibrio lentus TaxID=136468 RepID=UPI000C84D9C6|nr:hypothetical protein [Vibrio lentus]PMN26386.1 hypothetical protein BCT35_05130 [Vibrio lentus]
MPLTKDTYQNFYFGNSAEHHVMSKAFFHGVEAHKYNPDFGFDLCITNRAREFFKGESKKNIDVQVKATWLIEGCARFFIKKEEVEFLRCQKNSATVFCIYDAEILSAPVSFEDDREGILALEEAMTQSYRQSIFDNQKKNDFGKDEVKHIDIDDFEIDMFWLNSKQLNKAIEIGVLQECNEDFYMMSIIRGDGAYTFEAKLECGTKVSKFPLPEISKLKYLFRLEDGNSPLDLENFVFG